MKKTFHHVGMPTTRPRTGEIFLPEIRLYITDASQHPHSIEWVRFGVGCTLPEVSPTGACGLRRGAVGARSGRAERHRAAVRTSARSAGRLHSR